MRLSLSGHGPAVLKLAGIAGGVGLYREEMDAAIAAGFRVGGLDTSGDRADDPVPAALTWDGLASEVAQATDRLGERVVLWGTSYGCVLALATAARYPERVRGMLLCHPPDPRWQPRVYRAGLGWALRHPRPGRVTAVTFRLAFLVLNGWEFLAPTALRRLPALAREAVAAATPGSTILRKLELLWDGDPGMPPPQTRIPATVVTGSWDTVAPPRGARALASRMPGARLRTLRFSGHAGAYSRPRAYVRICLEELRRLSGGTRAPGTSPRAAT